MSENTGQVGWVLDLVLLEAANIIVITNPIPTEPDRPDPEEVAAFFNGLPQVPISKEHETCSICLEQYPNPEASSTAVKAMKLERPVKLPCGHVFGDKCIRLWLDDGHDSCPVCRRLFDI